jgi:NAD(P)H-flavin reductase
MSTASAPEVAVASDPLLPEPWVVRRAQRENEDVLSLQIQPQDDDTARALRPGQFNMLYAFGVGEAPISIAGIGQAGRVLHTIRDVGAVTHALCALAPGDVLGVRGPFGSRWPIEDHCGHDVIIAAGGIGLAPLRPVVETVLAQRDRYGHVTVLYGARGPEDLLYPHEHHRWRDGGIEVEVTVDHASRGWNSHIGVVTTLIRHATFTPEKVAAFLCGPEIMMQFTAQELLRRGVAPQRLFLSMERNMQCAVGFCGHCQLGPEFVCLDGPVFPWPRLQGLMAVAEL